MHACTVYELKKMFEICIFSYSICKKRQGYMTDACSTIHEILCMNKNVKYQNESLIKNLKTIHPMNEHRDINDKGDGLLSTTPLVDTNPIVMSTHVKPTIKIIGKFPSSPKTHACVREEIQQYPVKVDLTRNDTCAANNKPVHYVDSKERNSRVKRKIGIKVHKHYNHIAVDSTTATNKQNDTTYADMCSIISSVVNSKDSAVCAKRLELFERERETQTSHKLNTTCFDQRTCADAYDEWKVIVERQMNMFDEIGKRKQIEQSKILKSNITSLEQTLKQTPDSFYDMSGHDKTNDGYEHVSTIYKDTINQPIHLDMSHDHFATNIHIPTFTCSSPDLATQTSHETDSIHTGNNYSDIITEDSTAPCPKTCTSVDNNDSQEPCTDHNETLSPCAEHNDIINKSPPHVLPRECKHVSNDDEVQGVRTFYITGNETACDVSSNVKNTNQDGVCKDTNRERVIHIGTDSERQHPSSKSLGYDYSTMTRDDAFVRWKTVDRARGSRVSVAQLKEYCRVLNISFKTPKSETFVTLKEFFDKIKCN